jgi:hypothetical protein
MISSFRREADENCILLDYYAASSGNALPKFRDNLSVPSSRIMNAHDPCITFMFNLSYSCS